MIFPTNGKIRLFITGGTIDSQSIDRDGTYRFGNTHIREMLEQARNEAKIRREILMLKDSALMVDFERRIILNKCRKCRGQKIVITHGTDSMTETAEMLGRGVRGKTIVLTGSMIPYNQKGSDALFNLGCAIAAVQLLPFGTYIAMNGRIFKWNNVRKNRAKNIFEERK